MLCWRDRSGGDCLCWVFRQRLLLLCMYISGARLRVGVYSIHLSRSHSYSHTTYRNKCTRVHLEHSRHDENHRDTRAFAHTQTHISRERPGSNVHMPRGRMCVRVRARTTTCNVFDRTQTVHMPLDVCCLWAHCDVANTLDCWLWTTNVNCTPFWLQ